jgi:hypothetical protein
MLCGREKSCFCRESNPGRPARSPSLYRLNYPTSYSHPIGGCVDPIASWKQSERDKSLGFMGIDTLFLDRPAYNLPTEVCGTCINICQPACRHVLTLWADLSVGDSSKLREIPAGAWHDLNTLVFLCTCARQRELAHQRTCRTFFETKYYLCVSLHIGYFETCFMQNM